MSMTMAALQAAIDMNNEIFALRHALADAEARVRELEVAEGWRSMDEPPAHGQRVDIIVPATYYDAEFDPITAEMLLAGYYLSDDGDMLRALPTNWRPVPTLPTLNDGG